jgi:hypothetical protein
MICCLGVNRAIYLTVHRASSKLVLQDFECFLWKGEESFRVCHELVFTISHRPQHRQNLCSVVASYSM